MRPVSFINIGVRACVVLGLLAATPAAAEPLRLADHRSEERLGSFFVEEVRRQLRSRYDEDTLYRRAMLRPLDLSEPDEEALDSFRHRIAEAIEHDRLSDLRGAQGMLEHLRNTEIPTSALVEVLGFQFLGDQETRYRLLACDDAEERAEIVKHELLDIEKLLKRARPQRLVETPKGCTWN